MDKITNIIIGGALALTVTTASAAEVDKDSAGYLLPYCNRPLTKPQDYLKPLDYEQGRCMGIMSAWMAALQIAQADIGKARTGLLCIDLPYKNLAGMLRDVNKYAEAHPPKGLSRALLKMAKRSLPSVNLRSPGLRNKGVVV